MWDLFFQFSRYQQLIATDAYYHLFIYTRSLLCPGFIPPWRLLYHQIHHPLQPTPLSASVKDPLKLLSIEEKGHDGADVSYPCDKFKVDPQISDLICKIYRHEFRVLWQQMDPPLGKQQRLNKGNLRAHIHSNKVHGLLVEGGYSII